MAAVLLRLARGNPFRRNAGFDQIHRQFRQSTSATRRKRRSVIRPHVVGQPELAESGIKHRPDMVGVRAGQCLAAQKIAAMGVGNRQRFTPLAVTRQKPTLEVDAPDVVGGFTIGKRRTRWRAAPPQPALHRQPLAIEQLSDRARRRPIRLRRASFQIGPHLHRPPGRMRPSHLEAAPGNVRCNPVRMMQRRPRAVEQPGSSFGFKTRQPLVSNPTAHTEPPADRRERFLALLNCHHKPHPLFHGTGLLPSHRQGPPCRPVDLLPMSSVYSVTHVAGQDLLPFSPCGRRWRAAPDEGSVSAERYLSAESTPHPSAMLRIASTLSRKGRGKKTRRQRHEPIDHAPRLLRRR
jgi:hypothetical protein